MKIVLGTVSSNSNPDKSNGHYLVFILLKLSVAFNTGDNSLLIEICSSLGSHDTTFS